MELTGMSFAHRLRGEQERLAVLHVVFAAAVAVGGVSVAVRVLLGHLGSLFTRAWCVMKSMCAA